MPVPSDFDIRRPSGACTVAWISTSENGIWPANSWPSIIIRATHRLMMPRSVESTFAG